MSELVKFSELITFSAGINQSRLNNDIPEYSIYTLEDFDDDLCSSYMFKENKSVSLIKEKNVISAAGDVVISMTRNKAGIVSVENSGKYLNSNFIKCEFNKEELYPWYFCYLLNEADSINQQIKKMQQGTIGCINRLTVAMIGSLEFVKEPFIKQKTIGDLYKNMLINEGLMLKQMKNEKKFTLEVIKRIDKN